LADVSQLPSEVVPLHSVLTGDSPRLSGRNSEHIRLLAETQDLPPVLVHRPTMRVIDGAHRLQAARQRGDREVAVRYFDGGEDAAFVLAVRSNIAHGLPLTLADRTAAAARVLASYPCWSDRAIAQAVGLAPATVGAIRRRSAAHSGQSNMRIGRDGRMHPVDIAERRKLAIDFISKNPGASLREVARQAGISPATAQDVRRQLADRHNTSAPQPREAQPDMRRAPESRGRQPASAKPGPIRQPAVILQCLRKDPSLRSSEIGRELLRWLSSHCAGAEEWPEFVDGLPPHSIALVVEAAHGIARTWASFADALERRAKR